MFVGTAELTRLQDPYWALRSEIPEIFKRRIVLMRSVSFPLTDQQQLYTVTVDRVSFILFHLISFLYFINAVRWVNRKAG